MDWLELKIDTSHAGLDAVTDMLEQQGVTGVMIDDEADFQSFLENNRQYWDYVDDDLLAQKKGVSRVTFYLERNEDAYGTVAAVRMAMSALKKDHPEYAPLLLTMADVADEDWVHGISLPDFSFQDELRELIFNEILDRALQRSRAIFLIVSFLDKVFLHVITGI